MSTESGLVDAFQNETARAQELASLRPPGWEYELTAELIVPRLTPIELTCAHIALGLYDWRTTSLSKPEALQLLASKRHDLAALLLDLGRNALLLQEAMEASRELWAPLVIRDAVQNLFSACEELLKWEIQLRSVNFPDELSAVPDLMKGWGTSCAGEVLRFAHDLCQLIRDPDASGTHRLKLAFEPLANAATVSELIRVADASDRYRLRVVFEPPTLSVAAIIADLGADIQQPTQSEQGTAQPTRGPIPDQVKMYVWRRDGGRCVKCGSQDRLEYDHIIPLSKGGSNTERNVQLLCERCNRMKGDSLV